MKGRSPIAISVVIASKGRHQSLAKTADALVEQISLRQDVEIIVLEETNMPQPIEKEQVRYISIPERGYGFGYARNLGLSEAQGPLIVFVDDDIVPGDDWFSTLIKPFDDLRVGAAGGAILPNLAGLNSIGKAISFLGFPAGGLRRYFFAKGETAETEFISTGNCAFRAQLGRDIGGFDEFLAWGGEDQDFFARMSTRSKILFVPQAMVFHTQRKSIAEVFRWCIGRGMADFCIRCDRMSPILAPLLPLRRNFTLKLTILALVMTWLISFSPLIAALLACFITIGWDHYLWRTGSRLLIRRPADTGQHRNIVEETCTIITGKDMRKVLLLVKLTMDLGQETGILLAFLRYLRHRFYVKPFVLVLHRLAYPEPAISPESSKYALPPDTFARMVHECEHEGWRIFSLAKTIKRLKENPHSLYFSKIICITFDDAFGSVYETLTSGKLHGDYPFTVFVPTSLAGKSNEWDKAKGFPLEPLMTWDQIKCLSSREVEIGSHACYHVRLPELSPTDQRGEIEESMRELKAHLPAYEKKDVLFSYPYGDYDQQVKSYVKKIGYVGAVVNFRGNIRPKTDPYQIPRTAVHAGMTWAKICQESKSLWLRELLKDIRDLIFAVKNYNF